MANLLGTTVTGNVYVSGYSDVNPTNGSFRFYDGSTFRGGLGLNSWAFSGGSANDLNLYLANDSTLYISTNGINRHYFNSGEAAFKTYAPDLNYKISVVGGDQFNAYYGSGAATLYLQYHGNAGGDVRIAGNKFRFDNGGHRLIIAKGNGTMISNDLMDDAIGWNGSRGTYIGSTIGGTYYIYGNGTFYDNGTIRTLVHSGNIGSYALTSLPSHNHDDRYFTESESDGRFFFAQSSQLANTNLNDLTTRGVYYSADQYGTNTNIPFANYFTMINLTNDVGRQAQIWFGDTPGNAYWRPRQGDSIWHPWEKLITSNNIGSQSVSYATSAGNADTVDGFHLNQNVSTTSDPTFNSTYFANGNLRLYQGSGTALHIQTAYGSGQLGPQNGSWFHFETDRPNFYFGKSVHFNGPIYRYNGARFVEETGTWGISITGNSATVDGRGVGNSRSNVAYFNDNGNLFVNNPENYSGEVRLGAAWDRGGVYASGTLSLSTSASQIDFVFGDSTRAFFASDGNLWMSWAGTYLSTLLDGKASTNGNGSVEFYGRSFGFSATTFNPSTAPRDGLASMSIKMWNNYFNGTGLGSDYGTVLEYYSLSGHVDTQVYFDASGGSWYRSASYAAGWQGWQQYITSSNIGSQSVSYATSSGNSATTSQRSFDYLYTTSYLESAGGVYGTIFYDNNDRAYYLDPNSTGKSLNVAGNIDLIARSEAWAEGIRVRVPSTSTWGGIRFTRDRGNYSGNWAIGFTGIDSTDDLTFWGNDGTGGAMKMRLDQSSNLIAYGSMRAPIFYDSQDTGYYLDPNSGSRLNAITYDNLYWAGDTSYGFIGRNVYADTVNGRGDDPLELNYYDGGPVKIGTGTYGSKDLYASMVYVSSGNAVIHAGNIGSQSVNFASQTNAINITGYGNGNMTYYQSSGTFAGHGGWAGYFVSNHGDGATYYNQTIIMPFWGPPKYSRLEGGTFRGPYTFWSTENMDAPNKSGTSYYQTNTWMQFNGFYGLYWPGQYGAHFSPNDGSSYTQFRIRGEKNGYAGIYDDHSRVNGMMYDGEGNGGVYREANSLWYFYYHLGNNCMGIGTSTTSSSYQLYVNGTIYATGDVIAYSDSRKKTNIVTIDNALNKVLSMRGVFYDKVDEPQNGRQVGVIAQEVNEVLPEAVSYASDIDEYGVKYGNIVGVLIEAIKEQQAQINELKAKLDGLTK